MREAETFYLENIFNFIFNDLISSCMNCTKIVFKYEIQINKTSKVLQRTYQYFWNAKKKKVV